VIVVTRDCRWRHERARPYARDDPWVRPGGHPAWCRRYRAHDGRQDDLVLEARRRAPDRPRLPHESKAGKLPNDM